MQCSSRVPLPANAASCRGRSASAPCNTSGAVVTKATLGSGSVPRSDPVTARSRV